MNTSKVLNIFPSSLQIEMGLKLRTLQASEREGRKAAGMTIIERIAELFHRPSNSEIVYSITANGAYPIRRTF